MYPLNMIFVFMLGMLLLAMFKILYHYIRKKYPNSKRTRTWLILSVCLTLIFHDKAITYPRVNHLTVLPVSRQGNSLESYFRDSLNSVAVTDEMRYEWLRLRSFSTYPFTSFSHSPVRLARAGFSYTGRGQDCVCFSCGIHNSDWSGRNVTEIHRRLSPLCRHLNGGNETNIPIGSRESFQSSNVCSEPSIPEASNNNATTERTQPLESNGARNSENQTGLHTHPPSNPRTNRLQDMLEPLGIVFERPRYPTYSVLATRVSSFQHWPSCLTQTPRNLSTAGFFYLGHGDHVRCFYCGGGLRNWESGDDVWVEHARWFPKCPFLLQNRGTDFIKLVQRAHRELSENARSENNSEDTDIEQLPAARTVHEMGYTWETIRKTYGHFQGVNPVKIKVEDLIEELLKNNTALQPAPEEKSSNDQHNEGQQENTCSASGQNGAHQTNTNVNDSTINSELSKELETTSLNDETQSLIDENRRLRDQRLCRICMEEDVSIAFLPCGHLCCCVHCAPAMRKCPICRSFIKGTVKTFPA
uniref:Baculoviral IAP repeat-containing protein 7-A-like n=1 Tax=Crassostrea virginica TaxID=6565 RepID=A0A8B8AT63_CRAVI|nr:baculoviral IAP repeat-containing protein 7-A-like [Crassostrea virginica]XP_022293848.1 baculoviral IAP repeat-containing protein 7-A-like [Crassostrea virginica]